MGVDHERERVRHGGRVGRGGARVTRLEDAKAGARVSGIVPNGPVGVPSVEWYADAAIGEPDFAEKTRAFGSRKLVDVAGAPT